MAEKSLAWNRHSHGPSASTSPREKTGASPFFRETACFATDAEIAGDGDRFFL